MRKMIVVLLLVVGIVLGMVPTIVGWSENHSVSGDIDSLYDVADDSNNPAPCGGGMGSGGGGGLPG